MNLPKILNILESIFGKGKKSSKGEYLFFCPSCHHYKPKLIVKLDPSYNAFQQWHCWICKETKNTRGRTLFGLLKKFNATKNQIRELNDAIGERTYTHFKSDEKKNILRIPNEFVPLWSDKKNSIGKRHALVELNTRRISWGDIIRYNIGYCETGEYANRVIVPSYDENGMLNYFVARSYFKDFPLKYKNPEISKNIIAFDMYINWNLPIILCEGVFDAIAIRRNAIPLLGKTISDVLFEKIVIRRPLAVYIALDQDAIKDSVKIADVLTKEQISNYIVKLGVKDPSDLGFNNMLCAFKKKSILIDENSIFKLKIEHGFLK